MTSVTISSATASPATMIANTVASTSSTANNTGYIVPVGGPLSAPMSLVQMGVSQSTTTSGKRRGWPLKHCRRVYFYRKPVMQMYFRIDAILLNDRVNPILSDEETEEFKTIKSKLAKLYNNRFEEYYKMMCEERGVEYHPRGKTNKFILAE